MRELLKVLLLLIPGCVSSFSVTGCKHRTVIINCKYQTHHQNEEKYLCTGLWPRIRCEDKIRSAKKHTWERRGGFSLYDNPEENYFSVIIWKLNEGDQETKHWCAVNIPGMPDDYIELNINLLTGHLCPASMTKTAYIGSSLTIECKYPSSEQGNVGYFCKADNFHCKHLISSTKLTHTMKYTLSDDERGTYTVTISQLTQEDAGTYWCAMQRKMHEGSYIAQLTEVHLSITNWSDITPKELYKNVGEGAQIQCEYPANHMEYDKSLCKGENPFTCEKIINTTQLNEVTNVGRFSLRDNGRQKYYTVHIRNLSSDDSGIYWCSSSRIYYYTKFHLSVVGKPSTSKTADVPKPASPDPTSASTTTSSAAAPSSPTASIYTPVESSTSPSPSPSIASKSQSGDYTVYNTSTYVAAVFVSLAVLLVLTALIIYKHKVNKAEGAQVSIGQTLNAGNNTGGTQTDHDYEEVQERPQLSDSGTAPPPIYSLVSFPTTPSDPNYATISFHNIPSPANEGSVNISSEGTCEYSTVNHTPTTET